MASRPRSRSYDSLREIVTFAGAVTLMLGCTGSKSDDTDASDVPSLEACMMLATVHAGSRFQSEQDELTITFDQLEPDVPSLGDNRWQLTVRDADSQPVDDATLSVSLWMPEHAHGSLKATLIEALDDGQYRAEPLSFHMPGIWEVTLRIESDAASDQVTFDTCVVP
jgi:hypothetical protein